MSLLINPFVFSAAPAPAPALVSQTSYVPASSTTTWTVFSGLDLSDCDLAVVVTLVMGTDRTMGVETGTTAGWAVDAGRAGLTSNPNTLGRVNMFSRVAPSASEQLVVRNLPQTGSADSALSNMAAILFRINNANTATWTTANGPNFNSRPVNPPAHNTGAIRDALWIAVMGINSATLPTAYPAGYSNTIAKVVSSGAAGNLAAVSLAKNAQTEDPGTFTTLFASTARWGAGTIACYQS